jgi:cation diffusion facilitator family transporter
MSFKGDIRLQRNVLLIGFMLMGVKAVAYFMTNSNAILTDALESLVNITAGAFSLFSLYYASKPSDRNHPYGHGKIEFISGIFEGVLIGITGLSMMVKSIYGFFHPEEISRLDIGLVLAFGAGLVNFIMGMRLEKRGKAKSSMSMQSEGAHLKSDGYTSFALVAGLGIIFFTQLYWLDNVIALLLAIYISMLSYKILRKSLAGIMDETDHKLNEKALAILTKHRKPQWIDFHEFRIIRYGRSLHIDCHLVMPFYYNIKQEHEEVNQIERLLENEIGRDAETFIHTDPCNESYCKRCRVANCSYRKEPFRELP